MNNTPLRFFPLLAAVLLLCGSWVAMPALGADAEIVSILGKGEARATTRDAWQLAAVKQKLGVGAFVRTGDLSQMALLLRDHTQLRLNQNSMIQIKEVSPDGGAAKLELSRGRAWAQSKSRQPNLSMQTPNAIAAIRGTDWDIEVDERGVTTLTVLSGEVDLSNEFGKVRVLPNEQARVEPGKAPVKALLTNARERVQWVTAYRPQPRRWLNPVPEDLQGVVDAIEAGRYGEALPVLVERSRQRPDAGTALLLADLYLFLGRVQDAIVLLQGHADLPRAAALLARAYLIADRAADARAALSRVGGTHSDEVEILLARGDLARMDGDAASANAAFQRALSLQPDNANAWFGVGQVAAEREDVREGRRGLGRAIALDPAGVGYRGELATLESFASEFARAEKLFIEALNAQPDDYVSLAGLGILQLKRGELAAARESFLKAGVLEPRHARSALYTGVAYYQDGNRIRAVEMFRRAAELDPRDPLPHIMLSMAWSDLMQYGLAVGSARRAAELMPYLKSLNQVLNNQKGNANVGTSLAEFGLEEWAQAYAHGASTPYWAGSHLFLADRYSGSFNKNSELFKGFLSDPTVFGASNRFNTLVSSPGHYFSLGGRMTRQDYREDSMLISANGYGVSPVPMAYFISADLGRVRPERLDLSADGENYTLGLGARPTHELGLFAFANNFAVDGMMTALETGASDTLIDLENGRSDVGASYRFSPVSHLRVKFGSGRETVGVGGNFYAPSTADALNVLFGGGFSPYAVIDKYATDTDQRDVQLNHVFDAAANWQVSWGLESARQEKSLAAQIDFAPLVSGLRSNDERESDEAYVSNRFRLNGNLLLQADLSYIRLSQREWSQDSIGFGSTFHFDFERVSHDRDFSEWNPRLGLAWNVAPGHTLRLAAQHWRRPAAVNTLGPVDTAGIPLDDRLVAMGGRLERARLQYEWEKDAATFVQGFVDSRRISNLASSSSNLVSDLNLDSLERLRNRNRLSPLALDLLEAEPEFGEARVETAGIAVNRLFSSRLSGSMRYQYNHGRNTGEGFEGNLVPWLPQHVFNAGLNWLPAPRWQLGVNSTYRSARFADEENTLQLTAGWNFGLRSYWESMDKHWSAEVIVENLHADKNASPVHSAILAAQVLYRF